ncbi:zinc ribbon domain-containing protein [Candidatus Colwellia aromaticivorans]|uniref:zinc ribbon domain-containing protein n=1 Tax=Candidatus Colwellia aromaticivorans TaxID=2267621 RepID=UPI000DF43ACF|nr:zinc ribbon domain-containing protein [Candidatus Colwellia aromaticivorans]
MDLYVIYIVLWVVVSLIVASVASSKGHSWSDYFFLSLIISPIITLLIVIASSPNQDKLESLAIASGKERKCPSCAEIVKAEAKICKHCKSELPKFIPPTNSTTVSDDWNTRA